MHFYHRTPASINLIFQGDAAMQRLNLHKMRGHATPRMRVFIIVVVFLALAPAGIFYGAASPAYAQVAGDSLYAILYNGSSDYYIYMNNLKFMFRTLINDFGYTKDNIVVLSVDGGYYDLDGVYGSDIDLPATRTNLDSIFTVLEDIVTDGDVFFFYATDHGVKAADTPHSDCTDAALDVYSGYNIWEENLTEYIDRLDTETRSISKILLLCTCFAGGMIPELSALDYPLMICTASRPCEKSYHRYAPCDTFTSCDYSAYTYYWMGALHGSSPDGTLMMNADYNNDGNVTISEAARFAKANDEYAQIDADPKETPRYWDSDCVVGQITTLEGRLSSIPGFIAFRYPCHGPLPERHDGWGAVGGPWSLTGGAFRPAGRSGNAGMGLRTHHAATEGETTYVFVDVHNPGDTPLTSAEVKFYYSDPTLSLIYPQSGFNYMCAEIIPMLPPHGTVTVGPIQFVSPPGGNCFGEPYWTLIATAEHYTSPVESGWLSEDDHIAASNRFEITAGPEEAQTIHLIAHNPLTIPVKALLSVDADNWPSGWSAVLNPAAGDTIEISPGTWTPVEVVLTGYDGPVAEGFVDISMDMINMNAKECTTCDDSTCGGYIGAAGGCSIKLVVDGSVSVAIPEFTTAATEDAIALRWRASDEGERLRFNVYRAEKGSEDFLKLNDAPIEGSGWMSFVDETAAPGTTYLYMIGVMQGNAEQFSSRVEAALEYRFEFSLSQNFPNPFNPTTEIHFSLDRNGEVQLSIYDISGRLVRTIAQRKMTPGAYVEYWDGRDRFGKDVSSGVYFYRLKAGGKVLTRKMVVVR
jgi:hypothetical protein